MITNMNLPLVEGTNTEDWRTGSVSVQNIIDTIYSGKKDGQITGRIVCTVGGRLLPFCTDA